ncbi:MAG: hypothetical protein K2P43_04180, partial [Lachnospiraceae bacterium]|nr:hypothetical protein [Lachnospiraceae bacterium]
PELARAALEKEVFRPSEIYYHAPKDVRDGLIARLLETEDPQTAGNLMCCLAMQGDDKALETLYELEQNPRSWRKKLYVDPSVYAQCGGWTFDKAGKRRQLNFDTCIPLVKGDQARDGTARIFRPRKDRCPVCGGRLSDFLVLDGRDERLRFLGIDGIFTATACLGCIPWASPSYSRFTLDGGSTPIFPYEGGCEEAMEDEDVEQMGDNPYVLAEEPAPLFYGADWDETSTIGGFPFWIQDWEYTPCPDCGKPMKFLAGLSWEMLDFMEGNCYVEVCPECQVASMHHQQT